VRPYIIGRQGQTIQNISKKTGARINIPKQEDHAAPSADDEDATIDITIEGDAVAAEMARREIQSIINERTSTVNYRLKDIPAEFYPFLAGPRESNIPALMGGQDVSIKIPHYHTWSDVAPPHHVDRTRPVPFVAQPSLPIRISGDREAAQAAREQIERKVQALRQQLTVDATSSLLAKVEMLCMICSLRLVALWLSLQLTMMTRRCMLSDRQTELKMPWIQLWTSLPKWLSAMSIFHASMPKHHQLTHITSLGTCKSDRPLLRWSNSMVQTLSCQLLGMPRLHGKYFHKTPNRA
jgi:hypothetical protein